MEKIREGDSKKSEDAGVRKVGKLAKHSVFSNGLWLHRVEN